MLSIPPKETSGAGPINLNEHVQSTRKMLWFLAEIDKNILPENYRTDEI